MKPALQIVGGAEAELPEAPFAPDLKAKGWRFELDYERIETSDTWALARDEIKPWLLMLWYKAWQQTPIGSYPNNDEVISRKIGMDADMFAGYRHILMRGWNLHDDGRWHHPVIVETVERMLKKNKGNREAQERFREKQREKQRDNDSVSHSNDYVSITSSLQMHQNQNKNQNQKPEPEPSLSPTLSANPVISPSFKEDKERIYHGAQKDALHDGREIPSLPMLKDEIFYPQEADVVLWAKTYPAVDVLYELGKMRSWFDANPKKKRSHGGIKRFINNWLCRTQDDGGSDRKRNDGHGAPKSKFQATAERSQAFIDQFTAELRAKERAIDGECHEL